MTAQFTDLVSYRGKQYSIAGRNGQGMFDPSEHSMRPVGKCSALWHGFLCEYRVEGRALILDSLSVYLDEPAPILFGVAPKAASELLRFDAVYKDLNHKVPYTGGLLLASDFIEELYVHMGFHPAWKYREVHELILENGDLVRETDRSEEIAKFRDDMTNASMEPGREATKTDVMSWIERCFSQDYRW